MRIFIATIFLLITLVSCEKTETKMMMSFKGVVMDYDNNTVFPNVKTTLGRFEFEEPHSYHMIFDSTKTNNDGIFHFLHNYNEGDAYLSLSAYKKGYTQKYQRMYGPLQILDAATIHADTLFIGQATYLEIMIINNFAGKQFTIDINKNIPAYLFNSQADYNPFTYHISDWDTTRIILDRYLYKDNHEVYISWAEKSANGNFLNKSFEVIQMMPMDTSYYIIDLE